MLREFAARKVAGEDPGTREHAKFVVDERGRSFRYMKAIQTQAVCTPFHGTAVAQEVAAWLDALYAEDRAHGFEVGDIRSAFSIA